ncbi:hypothetical protein [Magnetospirillum sp. 64-120]|uniref:hypothetical protein n=1 Tax=Magnetospirillum sp. 64-120 TaxID=1895778 RepID=UPI000926282A|nr:hypothetical protein [Magnetospirillum sp. 64-120]OJX78262.1 MAG: hypothetical protein BGO92_02500 [Magnetospirillum sp. 64-120]
MMRVALVPEEAVVADESGVYLSLHEWTREAIEGEWRIPPTITGLIRDRYGINFRAAGQFLTHYLVAEVWGVEGHHRLLLVEAQDETLLLLRKDELTFLSDWYTTVDEFRNLLISSFLAREADEAAKVWSIAARRLVKMGEVSSFDDVKLSLLMSKELYSRTLLAFAP